jgi:hypothetical protein
MLLASNEKKGLLCSLAIIFTVCNEGIGPEGKAMVRVAS